MKKKTELELRWQQCDNLLDKSADAVKALKQTVNDLEKSNDDIKSELEYLDYIMNEFKVMQSFLISAQDKNVKRIDNINKMLEV